MTSRGRKDSYEMCQRLDRAARGRLAEKQSRRRRDDEGGEAVPAEPNRGPLPLEGGAEAPLD